MITADEVAAVAGGAANGAGSIAPRAAAAEATDYPRNPAGPVTTGPLETKFNRK